MQIAPPLSACLIMISSLFWSSCSALRSSVDILSLHGGVGIALQIKGTAMGTKMAPTYATLVLAYLEEQLYKKLEEEKGQEFSNFIKNNFHRYLDDCFIVWPKSKWNLNAFEQEINSLHSSFKFTKESDSHEIAFLDILVYVENKKLFTDIYYKPTDTHQYLHFSSCHPRHTKHSIPYSQARRLCTIIDMLMIQIGERKDY